MTDHAQALKDGTLDPKDLVGRRVKLKDTANQFFGGKVKVWILQARKVRERGDAPDVFEVEFVLARKFMGRVMKLRPVMAEEFEILPKEE